uniref:Uncharacterized protein n=1 Tax=Athene cunicularia TaxID=194338 RepID=A0A663LSC7_ATHCN
MLCLPVLSANPPPWHSLCPLLGSPRPSRHLVCLLLDETGTRTCCKQPFLAHFASLPTMHSCLECDAQHLSVPPTPTGPRPASAECETRAEVLLEAVWLRVFQAASEPCQIIPAKLQDPTPPLPAVPPDTCFSARGMLSPARCLPLGSLCAQGAWGTWMCPGDAWGMWDAQGAGGARGARDVPWGCNGACGVNGVNGEWGAGDAEDTWGAWGVWDVWGMWDAQGTQGAPGAWGTWNAMGHTGWTGCTGCPGHRGHTGCPGCVGCTGYPGCTGHWGCPGHVGYPGRVGCPGHLGCRGAHGMDGVHRVPGLQVHTGRVGCPWCPLPAGSPSQRGGGLATGKAKLKRGCPVPAPHV